jgi:hypothetical protein
MMQRPGIDALQCENRAQCGTITEYTEEERAEMEARRIELIQIRRQGNILIQERLHLSYRQASVRMLLQRGNPKTIDDFEIPGAIATLLEQVTRLESVLEAEYSSQCYIAPPDCEVRHYATKRPYGKYRYNKLDSTVAQFIPAWEEHPVKVLHLSHDDDYRNIEARRVERRRQLEGLQSKLETINALLQEAIATLES